MNDTDPAAGRLAEWGGPRQMSAFEASMWLAEADPRMRSTVTGVMMLDRAPDWDRLVAGVERMVSAVPRLRQRVKEPPLGLGLPEWEDDPEFLLEFHLKRLRLPMPGNDRQVLDFTQNLAMTPFDRVRPPWEVVIIEDLAQGRAAYVLKIHHVLSDGIGMTQLLGEAASKQRESRGLSPNGVIKPHKPSGQLQALGKSSGALLFKGFTAMLGGYAGLAERAMTWWEEPERAKEAANYAASAKRVLTGKLAKGSPLFRHRSRNWRFDIIEMPLADLKASAKALDASINDVFLAGLFGGFRRYHEELGVVLAEMPVAFPISLRKPGDTAGGNHFAGAQYSAPIGERDVCSRVKAVRQFVRQVRQEPALDIVERISPLLVHLPGSALGQISQAMTSKIDVQISNVPGFAEPIYVAGARVTHHWPFGPVPGCAMMIAMVSYDGCCSIGLSSDRAAVLEPELLIDCLRTGLEEVAELGRATAASAGSALRTNRKKRA